MDRHVVFGYSSAGYIKDLKIGEVFLLADNLSIGPLSPLSKRENFFKKIGKGRAFWNSEYENGRDKERDFSHNYIEIMKEDISRIKILNGMTEGNLIFWVGSNAFEEVSFLRAVSNMKYREGLYLVKVPRLKIEHPQGNYFAKSIGEIPSMYSSNVLKKCKKRISKSDFTRFKKSWKSLDKEASLRVWKSEFDIISKKENYYDSDIISCVTRYFTKFSKVMACIFSSCEDLVDFDFLVWRMRVLSEKGKIKVRGKFSNLPSLFVRKA